MSCFLVTAEIEVISRSISSADTNCWIGRSNGSYEVVPADSMDMPGTLVRLKLSNSAALNFGSDAIISFLTMYGYLVDLPILFTDSGRTIVINNNFIPWRQSAKPSTERILQWGEELFDEEFLDVVPIQGEGLTGYAFISMEESSASAQIEHKIYLKNMFMTKDGRDLIPKWAFFTRCFLNSEDLTPTASREGFQRNSHLRKSYARIERCLLSYFQMLSRSDTDKLKLLTNRHNLAIKALTLENESVYKLFFPFLVFPTTQGELTGMQLMEAAQTATVYYCSELDTYRRVAPFMKHSHHILVNAGYVYDGSIFTRLLRFYRNTEIRPFEEMEFDHLFHQPRQETEQAFAAFMQQAEGVLQEFTCCLQLRCFTPLELPAFYLPGNTGLSEDNWEDWQEEEAEEDSDQNNGQIPSFIDEFFGIIPEQKQSNTLYLNVDNTMIQTISRMQDPTTIRSIARILYVQALLAGRYPVGPKELAIMNEALTELITARTE